MFFFLTATATSHIYTLSLHDALPISYPGREAVVSLVRRYSRHVRVPGSSGREGKERSRYSHGRHSPGFGALPAQALRSEEHTSELQSRENLVCRLLLEKKKNNTTTKS